MFADGLLGYSKQQNNLVFETGSAGIKNADNFKVKSKAADIQTSFNIAV